MRVARQARDKGLIALETLVVQSAKLDERLVMIVDTQMEERIFLGREDEQRRRLPAALVAACCFSCFQRTYQAFGE
jgi:hypothetical protein